MLFYLHNITQTSEGWTVPELIRFVILNTPIINVIITLMHYLTENLTLRTTFTKIS